MLHQRLILAFNFVCFLFCSFSTYAASQEASVVKLSEWGSHPYADIAKVGGLLFLMQGDTVSRGNSNTLDVMDESFQGADSFIKSIQMPSKVLAIETFNNDLVVIRRGFLGIYSVDSNNELTLEYELATNTYSLSNYDKIISIKDNKLALLDNETKLHLIEFVEDKYQLVKSYEAEFLPQDTFNVTVIIGLETNKIYIGRISDYKQADNEYITTSYSYTDDTLVYNADTTSTLITATDFVPKGVYTSEGKFVISLSAFNNSVILISHHDGKITSTVDTSQNTFCCDITANDQNIWVTNGAGYVSQYDVSDPTNMHQTASGKGVGITTETVYITKSKIIDGNLYALDKTGITKVTINDNSSVISKRESLYYQAGQITGFVVEDDKIVVSKNNRIQILEQQSPAATPTLLTQSYSHLVTTHSDAFAGVKLFKLNETRYLRLNNWDLQILELNSDNTTRPVLAVGNLFIQSPLIHNDNLFFLSTTNIGRYDVLREGGLLGNHRLFDINFDVEEYGTFRDLKIVGDHIVLTGSNHRGRKYLLVVSNIYSNELTITDSLHFEDSSFFEHIDSKGEYLYWIGAEGKIKTYTITKAGKLALLHTTEGSAGGAPESINVSNESLIVTYPYGNGLDVGLFSLADPARPQYVSNNYSFGAEAWGGAGYEKTLITHQGVIYQSQKSSGVLSLYQVNYAPTPLTPIQVTQEDTPLVFDIQSQDPEGDPVFFRNLVQPASGSIAIDENNVMTYTPEHNFYGQDSFSVALVDIHGNYYEATEININVLPVNDPPIALKNQYTGMEDELIFIELNTLDPEGNEILVNISNSPQYGQFQFDKENKQLIFSPNQDFYGEDSATIKLCDELEACTETSITLYITPIIDAPKSISEQYNGIEDTPITINLRQLLDPESDTITIEIIKEAENGQFTFEADSKLLLFSPTQNFYGENSAIINLCNEQKECTESSVLFLTTPVNDAPIVSDESFTLNENETYTSKLNVEDVDDDSFQYNVTQSPENGTLDIDELTGDFSYTPANNYSGTDRFVYEVVDKLEGTGTATITFTIKASPVAVKSQPESTSSGGGSLSVQYLIFIFLYLVLIQFKLSRARKVL